MDHRATGQPATSLKTQCCRQKTTKILSTETIDWISPLANFLTRPHHGNRFIYGVEASLDERGKASEYEFIRSVKISNRDIIKGIGATQSLIGIKRWQKTGYVLAGAGAASFLAGTLLDISRSQNTLLGNTTDYTFTQSVELGELRIEDVPKIVKFNSRLNEPLAKDKWAEFEVELTNTAGDVVGWYDTEFWRETGYDEGYWDESDYGDSRLIKIEEPGIYKVTGFIGETNVIRAQSIESAINQNLSNNPATLNITLTVTDNALSKKPFLFALFAGLVGGMLLNRVIDIVKVAQDEEFALGDSFITGPGVAGFTSLVCT